MANPEQALWRAVIDQAIKDASGKECKPLDRAKAHDWLFKPDRNFDRVCALAGLEPDYVRTRARQAIDEQARKPPRKSYHRSNSSKPKGKLYEFNGRFQNLSAWAQEIGCSYPSLYQRLTKGWTLERALTTPFAQRNA